MMHMDLGGVLVKGQEEELKGNSGYIEECSHSVMQECINTRSTAAPAGQRPDIDATLEHILETEAATLTEVQRLDTCLKELARTLAPLGRVWRIAPYGSVKNTLRGRGSDMDVTIYRADGLDEGNSTAAVWVLDHQVRPLVLRNPRFSVTKFVTGARIPILSLRFDDDLDVDLSCHNREAVPNSELLRAYALVNPLVRGLAMLVKVWAKANSICGAEGGNLTSYAFALMVVYDVADFLQVHPRFKLPLLSTELPLRSTELSWHCQVPLSEALQQFFAFYAEDFRWGTEARCVSAGGAKLAARSSPSCGTPILVDCTWKTLSS
jgi:DNA polymerase sigma